METDEAPAAPSSTLFLDRVGEVVLSLQNIGLSWKSLASDDLNESSKYCLGLKFHSKSDDGIKFSNVYAVETIETGLMYDHVWNGRWFFSRETSEMYRFVVHGFRRCVQSPWTLSAYTFGHPDLETCQRWVEKLNACATMQVGRPKNLLVFVHPVCGKGDGCNIWETVAPIFCRAKVNTKVIVTKRAGHAFGIVSSSTDRELTSFDGIVAVGGDGLFNEVLNGLLSSRHKAPYPPNPTELKYAGNADHCQNYRDKNSGNKGSFNDLSGSLSEIRYGNDDNEPLLLTSDSKALQNLKLASNSGPCSTDSEPLLTFPNNWFRLGIIPSGSTDAIVISTTGLRDPITSALQIILGESMPLDIAQVVRWKSSPSSIDLPSVRYAASFAGYGFYGDVVKESENYRWMGPKRYDFAGTMVFLKHRSYEAEVTFLDARGSNAVTGHGTMGNGNPLTQASHQANNKLVCRKNCIVCNETASSNHLHTNGAISISDSHTEDSRWSRSKGRFLSIGAAVISCRNERAPDGLVADAHLADGFLHLILIKDCPRPYYLWHLTQLTRRGSNPLNLEFVEHHKTPAFTFVSSHDESVWNLDGELFQACQVSVQACRGLVNLFASGPDV